MKKILHIEASPRKDRSHSINVTKKYIDKIQKNGDVEIKKIDLWNYDLPEFDGDMLNAKYAVIAGTEATAEHGIATACCPVLLMIDNAQGQEDEGEKKRGRGVMVRG